MLSRQVNRLTLSPRKSVGCSRPPIPNCATIAYSILARWIYRRNLLSTPTLLALTNTWRSNIAEGIGETGTNSVLKRSFSALCLSAMAERESKLPFMGRASYHNLVAQAVAYLQAERDLREYDPILH